VPCSLGHQKAESRKVFSANNLDTALDLEFNCLGEREEK